MKLKSSIKSVLCYAVLSKCSFLELNFLQVFLDLILGWDVVTRCITMNEKMVKTIKKIKSLCNSMSWIEKVGKERVVPFNSISNFAPTPVWNFSPVLILPYKLHQLFVNLPGYSSRMVTLLNPFLNVTNCKKVSTKEICRHSKLRGFFCPIYYWSFH